MKLKHELTNDYLNLLETKLKNLIKREYGDNSWIFSLDSVDVTMLEGPHITLRVAWGKKDGSIWNTGELSFLDANDVSLDFVCGMMSQLILDKEMLDED